MLPETGGCATSPEASRLYSMDMARRLFASGVDGLGGAGGTRSLYSRAVKPRPALWILFSLAVDACHPGVAPDTLVVAHDLDVEGLDPHTAGGLWQTQTVLANLYEGLVGFDAQMSLVPALAVSWSNPDDFTWDFQLRANVPFHTGGALEPEDVVFSFRRARDHPRSVLRATLADIEEIRQLDGNRIRLQTRDPDAALLARLRDVLVVSRRFVEGRGEQALGGASAGTGPYRVGSREVGSWVDLERFDRYWKGPAPIPRARFLARSYGDPGLGRFVPPTGRLVFWARPGTDLHRRALTEAVPYLSPGLAVTYLSFDLRGPTTPAVTLPDGTHRNPFLDRRVREAIARAIRHDRLKKEAVDDQASIPTQLVPPAALGFDPSFLPLGEDPEEARRLMAGTPFREGFEVDLDLREIMARYGPPLVEDLAAIGIRARARARPEKEFFASLGSGASSLYVLRFSCRTGDAQEFFDKWAHSRDEARGYGQFNYSYQVDPIPGLDAAIEAARRELRPGVRMGLLQGTMRRVMEARLAVPLTHEKSLTFASPDVEWTPRVDTFRLIYEARFRK